MKMILSAQNTEYLETEVGVQAAGDGAAVTTVDEKTRYQTILGFGGAFTQAAAVTFSKMGKENQKRILKAYFDKNEGLGYALGRVSIASSDFSEDMYDYLKGEDATLESFDITREDAAVFPMVKAAEAVRGESLRLLASPWSPPAFMKDNKNRKHGGTLLPEFYPVYAKYVVKYIKEARKRGIPVEFLSVQNEPEATQTWDSCRYTAEQERDFLKDHLAPALEEAGLGDVKLLVHDHNRDILFDRVTRIYADADAAKKIWGAATHWYVSEDFAVTSKLHEKHPDKHILFTEGCVEGGPAPGKWSNGERYARNIIGDLNNWVEGWIEWNLVLDTQGGPNHVGNFCCAPILCDPDKDTLIINPSYHFIGHIARHIKPNAVRVAHNSANAELKTLSARNPDGGLVFVALNETDKEQPLALSMGGQTVSAALPPRSIATFIS